MDPQTTALILAIVGAAWTLAVALLVWALNRLWHRIDRVEVKIDALDAKIDAKFDGLQGEIERSNRILTGLANHRHDVDGNTVFNVPAD